MTQLLYAAIKNVLLPKIKDTLL